MRATFTPYTPRSILNARPRADTWFWTRYSAYPYLGCQHGCEFCYCRERKFSPFDDPHDFAFSIRVKRNAAELLRQGLRRKPVDVVGCGDYQPAERKFKLTRRMLEVLLELGYPVVILSRSPLVLRDLDLLREIHQKARVVVLFSLVAAPGAPAEPSVRLLEHLAPPAYRRLAAMEQIAAAGIPTGISAMPLLPGLCDDDANLQALMQATANAGAGFALASSLTLADQQREYFFGVLAERLPQLLPHYQALYPPGSYGPAGGNWPELGRRVRQACQAAGISDRMPRPIIPGEKRARNKRLVEWLANECYTQELAEAPESHLWALRKAAWAIEDLPQDIGLLYRTMGLKGLSALPGMDAAQAQRVAARLDQPGEDCK